MHLWKKFFSFFEDIPNDRRHIKMAIQKKIKLFQSLFEYFQILGTFSPELNENRKLNQRNIFVLFCYIQLIVSAFAFTLFKATTLIEFGLNFYGYVTQSLCTFIVLLQIYRMLDILKFIENCEKLIEMSKSTETNRFRFNFFLCNDCCNPNLY